jgi:hypothetical protein
LPLVNRNGLLLDHLDVGEDVASHNSGSAASAVVITTFAHAATVREAPQPWPSVAVDHEDDYLVALVPWAGIDVLVLGTTS